MTTIADRLAAALDRLARDEFRDDDDPLLLEARGMARDALRAYESTNGRDEPVSPAPQGPGAEHWKQAIDEWVDDPVDSDEIEKRANELAGGGE